MVQILCLSRFLSVILCLYHKVGHNLNKYLPESVSLLRVYIIEPFGSTLRLCLTFCLANAISLSSLTSAIS